jgi:TolB protein
MRFKQLLFFWLPFFLFADIEVRLKTEIDLKPLYLSEMASDPTQVDWRYLEELRAVVAYDLQTGGFVTVLPVKEEQEHTFHWPDIKRNFDLTFWKRAKIPFVVGISIFDNALQSTVFNIEKGTSKRYPALPITGCLEEDRKQLHAFADAIHKDLFGIRGIASLRLIYSQRYKNPVSDTADWLSEIWMNDFDGAHPIQATFENSYCINPSFYLGTALQDDPSFFFISYKQGQSKIYRSSLRAKSADPVIELRGNHALPALNRKGSQMAFIADTAGRPDLFVQNFDSVGKPLGKARQLFSSPRATQASPTFSPDGATIAFVSDKDGPPRIYTIPVASPQETRRQIPQLITKKNRENTAPAWAPDGKKLAYSAKVDGVRQIWIYDFETEEETPLTTGPENKENPSWAPNSLHLVYNTDNEEEGQLFVINLHQKQPVQITKGPGQKRFASWETRANTIREK